MANDVSLTSAQMREHLASDDKASTRERLENEHPVDIAELISGLDVQAAWMVLEQPSGDKKVSVFSYLSAQWQVALAQSVDHQRRLGEIVSQMGADDRADFYKEFPPEQQQALLPRLAQAEREDIRGSRFLRGRNGGRDMASTPRFH